MINFLKHRFRYKLEDDHNRLKICLCYLSCVDTGYLKNRGDDHQKFISLIGMNEESIKYRLNKKKK